MGFGSRITALRNMLCSERYLALSSFWSVQHCPHHVEHMSIAFLRDILSQCLQNPTKGHISPRRFFSARDVQRRFLCRMVCFLK
jgi:hypothetical protein